jgi:integrase
MPDIESPDSVPRTALGYDVQVEQLNLIPEPHRDFIEFLMEAGLRPAEGCALKIGDYHPSLRKILVQRTYSRNVLIETTKGKSKIWRTLSTRANELILSAIGNEIDPDRFVFINPATGRGYLCEFTRKLWRKHTTVSEDLYASTRHSLASQLADDGAPARLIQETLGHKDIRSTNVYMHPTDSKKREYLDGRGKVVEMKRKVK